jgi:hypothetical protein
MRGLITKSQEGHRFMRNGEMIVMKDRRSFGGTKLKTTSLLYLNDFIVLDATCFAVYPDLDP